MVTHSGSSALTLSVITSRSFDRVLVGWGEPSGLKTSHITRTSSPPLHQVKS